MHALVAAPFSFFRSRYNIDWLTFLDQPECSVNRGEIVIKHSTIPNRLVIVGLLSVVMMPYPKIIRDIEKVAIVVFCDDCF